jgi:hypothetical protein
MRWITVGPADQPGTSIVLNPPAAAPGSPKWSRSRPGSRTAVRDCAFRDPADNLIRIQERRRGSSRIDDRNELLDEVLASAHRYVGKQPERQVGLMCDYIEEDLDLLCKVKRSNRLRPRQAQA